MNDRAKHRFRHANTVQVMPILGKTSIDGQLLRNTYNIVYPRFDPLEILPNPGGFFLFYDPLPNENIDEGHLEQFFQTLVPMPFSWALSIVQMEGRIRGGYLLSNGGYNFILTNVGKKGDEKSVFCLKWKREQSNWHARMIAPTDFQEVPPVLRIFSMQEASF